MTEDPKPDSLKQLDDRLQKLRQQEAGSNGQRDRPPSATAGLGFAMRLGVELVVALGIGVGIGVLLDRWLETTPWLMLVFFVLGVCAGFLNLYRVVTRSTQVVGHAHTKNESQARTKDDAGSP